MDHDYRQLIVGEMGDMSDFLQALDAPRWNTPSLCAGWKVRHVVGHMMYGYYTPFPSLVVETVKHRGNVNRTSFDASREFGNSHTPTQLKQLFAQAASNAANPSGLLVRFIPIHERFTDHLIHHQDVRRPLGMPRAIPEERLAAALDALPKISGLLKSNKLVEGLRFSATDIGHSVGTGPEVSGPAEALILAMSGRPAGLDELGGDGLPTLIERVKSR